MEQSPDSSARREELEPKPVLRFRREAMQSGKLRPLTFRDVELPAEHVPGPGVAFRREAVDAASARYPFRGDDYVGKPRPSERDGNSGGSGEP